MPFLRRAALYGRHIVLTADTRLRTNFKVQRDVQQANCHSPLFQGAWQTLFLCGLAETSPKANSRSYIRVTRVLDAIHNIRPLPSAVNTFYVDPALTVFRKAGQTAGPLFHFRPSSSDRGFGTELLPRCASRRWSAPRRDLQWFAPPSGCGRGRGRSGLAAPWLAQASVRHHC